MPMTTAAVSHSATPQTPYRRIDFMAGRQHALTTLESLLLAPSIVMNQQCVDEVLDNLDRGTEGRPAGFAAGVLSVTRSLRQ